MGYIIYEDFEVVEMERGIYLVSIVFLFLIFGLVEERSFRRGLFGEELYVK